MNFRTDINGLRAIAVLTVVFYHFGIPGFQGGFVGVDVFFVISGFLMTGIIFKKLDNNAFSLFDFYMDRAKRIIPALFVLCIILMGLGWFILLPNQYALLGKHAATTISFLSNHFYWQETGYFEPSSNSKWLLHSWSLSVEWQFYMLYPLLVLLLWSVASKVQIRLILVFLTFVSFGLSVILTKIHPVGSFFLLPTRAWEMLAGGLIYLFPIKTPDSLKGLFEKFGLAIIAACTVVFTKATLWPGYLALLPVTGAIFVLISNNHKSFILNNKVTQWFGTTSYSIYLWHWPTFAFLFYINQTDNLLAIIISIVMSFLLGYLSYLFVETNAKKIKTKIPDLKIFKLASNKIFIMGIAMMLTTGALGSYLHFNNGFPSRISDEILGIAEEANNKNPRSEECYVYPSENPVSPSCVFGNEHNIKAVVIGDSHSNTVITAIEKSLHGLNGGALFLGADGCFSLINTRNSYFKKCNLYNEWVWNKLEEDRRIKSLPIIIVNRTTGFLKGDRIKTANTGKYVFVDNVRRGEDAFESTFIEGYQAAVCRLSESNPIYIMKPIPEMDFDVPQYLAKMKLFGLTKSLDLSISEYQERHSRSIQILEDLSGTCGISLLDPLPYLCIDNNCSASRESRPMYYDDDHLSEYGSSFLISLFSKLWEE